MRIELLCKVVDNFGDAGVCARLARQLANEYGASVRLWTDQPELVTRFLSSAPSCHSRASSCPSRESGNPEAACHEKVDPRFCGDDKNNKVEIRLWPTPFPNLPDPGDMVIEAFACTTPPELIAAMKAAPLRPLWVNLEYLSAEEWVDGCHGQISLHPSGLKQVFVFPGFTEKTGGLIREQGLLAARAAFDPAAFWARLGVPEVNNELRISLFCYKTAPLDDLIAALAQLDRPSRLLAPEGLLDGKTSINQLTLQSFRFLSQNDYDQLLWACDLNFVRGEDSFVRAHWAQNPFIWHIYKQDEQAHLVKLEAFLARIKRFFAPNDAETLALLHQVWNLPAHGDPTVWLRLIRQLPDLKAATEFWVRHLAAQPDLARQLMELARQNKGSQL